MNATWVALTAGWASSRVSVTSTVGTNGGSTGGAVRKAAGDPPPAVTAAMATEKRRTGSSRLVRNVIGHLGCAHTARSRAGGQGRKDGLAFAHKAGIIHRDVKPANIMVDEEGSLKILDFGIARLAESAGMTQAGMMVGTLNYMSPEQVIGQTADRRSDIFAVGLVFYEMLAQKEAFPGTVTTGVLGKILHTEPQPLAEVCPGLDEDVIRIVGRAIEKDANRRYQDLTEMRREILTVRASRGGR